MVRPDAIIAINFEIVCKSEYGVVSLMEHEEENCYNDNFSIVVSNRSLIKRLLRKFSVSKFCSYINFILTSVTLRNYHLSVPAFFHQKLFCYEQNGKNEKDYH
jgi:hypothetical protein